MNESKYTQLLTGPSGTSVKRFYAGIGSRRTPITILEKMSKIAAILESMDFVLRSGGASGADTYFERGVSQGQHKQIFTPWNGFNNYSKTANTPPNCFEIARSVHPNWNACTDQARALHARNVQQILGPLPGLSPLSSFVLCWTPEGKDMGGTATAIKLARREDIPVVNFGKSGVITKYLDGLMRVVRDICEDSNE